MPGGWRPPTRIFRRSDGSVHILGVWFESGLQLKRNWSEVRAKVKAQMGTWLRRRLSLKGRAEVCAVYIFPLILYHLSVLPQPESHRVALTQSLSKVIWKGRSLGMPDLESHRLAERLAYLGRSLSRETMWGRKLRVIFLRLQSNPEVEGRRRPKDEVPFTLECPKALRKLPGSSDLSRPRKELYGELVVGSASDPLVEQLGWSLAEICSQWNWVPSSSRSPSELRVLAHLAAIPEWTFRACIADMLDCPRCGSSLEETTLPTFYYCERVRTFWSNFGEWTTRISP